MKPFKKATLTGGGGPQLFLQKNTAAFKGDLSATTKVPILSEYTLSCDVYIDEDFGVSTGTFYFLGFNSGNGSVSIGITGTSFIVNVPRKATTSLGTIFTVDNAWLKTKFKLDLVTTFTGGTLTLNIYIDGQLIDTVSSTDTTAADMEVLFNRAGTPASSSTIQIANLKVASTGTTYLDMPLQGDLLNVAGDDPVITGTENTDYIFIER